MIYLGDLFDVLPTLVAESIDACVTDPPYDLTANKKGGSGSASINLESPYGCARIGTGNGVGGFMGKRWDGTGVAFKPETWRLVASALKPGAYLVAFGGTRTFHRLTCAIEDAGFEIRDCLSWLYGQGFPKSLNVGEGRGTALKPSWEPIILARKPTVGAVKANVEKYGTSALNIDACRIEECRSPANVLLDEESATLLDKQTGNTQSGQPLSDRGTGGIWSSGNGVPCGPQYGDFGGASRFYYVAKPSRKERDYGLHELSAHSGGEATSRIDGSAGLNSPRAGAGRGGGSRNIHPTVKPVRLMCWLVRLVTPSNGVVLDPFMGSGTTGIACRYEQRQFIGIEREASYIAIAERRISETNPLLEGDEQVEHIKHQVDSDETLFD